jgi:hypothetical protein
MCHKTITLAKNCDGQLSFCKTCILYHLTFNNIRIEFTKRELQIFIDHVNGIEAAYWESRYERTVVQRKITIQTMQQNLTLVFNKQELMSLKTLLNQTTKKPFEKLNVMDVDYLFFLN